MAVELDFADIQGNILSAYGKEGFPKGRFMLFHIEKGELACQFVTALLPMITTALRWPSSSNIPTGKKTVKRPDVTVNIAFTWYGLLALGIPTRTLRGMPDEFIDGVTARAPMLGDDFTGPLWKNSWDEVWINSGQDRGTHPDTVHFLITLNSQMNPDGSAVPALDEQTQKIMDLVQEPGGVRLLTGHNRPGHHPKRDFQELSALLKHNSDGTATPLPKEHFGFTDAIGDPVFEGQYPNDYEQVFQVGNGAFDGKGNWRPLRRRILRRGLPYGESPEGTQDEDEHGIVMLVVCASLFRQFEFVQQQWINYGNDSRAGNDTCPIVGNHSNGRPGGKNGPKAKFVIPADPASGHPAFIVEGIPQFVETRGGEYFFVPSMIALRMIGMGVVDPT